MPNQCLIITAIGQPNSESRKLADKHIKVFEQACNAANAVAVRIDLLDTERYTPEMWKLLTTARVAIADLSIPNVNAAYELGIRHGLQMPTIVVTNNIEAIPFDLHDLNVHQITYTDNDIEKLSNRIKTPIRQLQDSLLKSLKARVVHPNIESEFNESFYDAYEDALQSAQHKVLTVGSGFDNDSPRALAYMRVLTGCALRTKFNRIETASKDKIEWLKMIAKFLLPMSNFALYVPKDPDDLLLRDIALIDWDNEDTAKVQFMFHTQVEKNQHDLLDERKVQRAGHGIFCHSKTLASDLYKIVQEMNARKTLIKLKSPEDMRKHFGFEQDWLQESNINENIYYFAYGSNLLHEQLQERVGEFKVVGSGALIDYRFCFTISGTVFKGAVANIIPDEGKITYGVIYELPHQAIEKLDFFEGVAMNEYSRQACTVVLSETKKAIENCIVYLNTKQDKAIQSPSDDYFSRIISGCKQHNLPTSHISYIESLRNSAKQ